MREKRAKKIFITCGIGIFFHHNKTNKIIVKKYRSIAEWAKAAAAALVTLVFWCSTQFSILSTKMMRIKP